MSDNPITPQGERHGPGILPQPESLHCVGCAHLLTKWWKDYLENDETDSGTSARCAAVPDEHGGRSITAYWSERTPVPRWCPYLPPAPGEETPHTLKQQDRLRAAVFPLGAGNSELEPDGQGSRSCRADRQSGEDRQIGGRAAFLSGGLQCSQRDVRGGIVENDHVSEVARGPEARATLPPAPGESA